MCHACGRIHLSNSFQTRFSRGPSDSCGPDKLKNAVGTWGNEQREAIQPGTCVVCAQPATYMSIKQIKTKKLASYLQNLDNKNANAHKEELELG